MDKLVSLSCFNLIFKIIFQRNYPNNKIPICCNLQKNVSLGITIMIQSFNICSLEMRIALFYYQKESKKLSFTNDHGKTGWSEGEKILQNRKEEAKLPMACSLPSPDSKQWLAQFTSNKNTLDTLTGILLFHSSIRYLALYRVILVMGKEAYASYEHKG